MTVQATKLLADEFGALVSRRLRKASIWAGWLVIGIAALTLIGWSGNIDWLKTPLDANVPMKVNASICFLLGGLSLLTIQSKKPLLNLAGSICALALLFMCLATIAEYAYGIHLTPYERMQEHLLSDVVPPERMPPSATMIFLVAVLGLLCISSGKQEKPALLVVISGLMALFSYAFGARMLFESYGAGYYRDVVMTTRISWVAAVAFVVFGLGILFAEPERALGGLLCSPTRGGYIVRRFLPLVLGVPLLFGALTVAGQLAHFYNTGVRWFLFVNCSILFFCWFTCYISKRLDIIDKSRLALAEQRADIAYSLAHDLKVPIIGNERAVELLLSGALGELKAQQKDLLVHLIESSNDQLQLIDNLVYEYHSEQGEEPLMRTMCSITRLLNDCLTKMLPMFRSKNLRIKVEHSVPLYSIEVDELAIRRVINNLLHNATKYTPTGGELKISSSIAGEQFTFTIWNSGPSLSDHIRKHMFERFWQSEETRRLTTGNGMGLYICRQIVEAHGGTIACLSEEREGTAFTVNLPAKAMCLSARS